ncbi:malonyl-CoA-acyl carrier protein transacylase, mitochondrial [Antechinus flavipes]|uniref:malonyl-CoA-acyl carrier protein transacylase, mitochondrial n=1 Tax=Antechinus flavipes TaxID=38775 RepID=UPI002236533E|nr:malonyl-CoA-acyl carrier protein transacylase, mitochondrial [Antechinus flavipes]
MASVMAARWRLGGRASNALGRRLWSSRARDPAGPPPPSEVEDVVELLKDATLGTGSKTGSRPRRRPETTSVLLFPGQGSQIVGMGRALLRYPGARALYESAARVLGYDLLELSLRGPREALDRTVHCQPALYVVSLAALEALRHKRPEVIENCVAAAGFSVGEFAALVFAGALEFEEGLHAVKVRAEAMQEASAAVPSGMLSVLGKPQTQYKRACLDAREHCQTLGIEQPVCEVANYLFPDCRVISGHLQALQFLQKNSSKYHFRRTKMLPVSGAFHTQLMEPALEPLAQVLKKMDIKKPLVSVYSNVDGNKYVHAKYIQKLLVKQVVCPVKWEQIMHAIFERRKGTDFPQTFEVGPGKQLGAVLRNCNLKAWRAYSHVEVTEEEEPDEEPLAG